MILSFISTRTISGWAGANSTSITPYELLRLVTRIVFITHWCFCYLLSSTQTAKPSLLDNLPSQSVGQEGAQLKQLF